MTDVAPGQMGRVVNLDAVAVFEGYAPRPWSPVAVTVRNPGPDPLAGELSYGQRGQSEGFRARRELFLGPGGTKRVFFYVPEEWGLVQFTVGGTVLAETNASGNPSYRYGFDAALLVTVAEQPGSFKFLEQTTSQSRRSPDPLDNRYVAQVREVELLPDRWVGYSGVKAVILSRVQFDTIPAPQQRALLEWVQTGGWLILSPGADARWLTRPPLAGLIDLEVVGNQEVTRAPALERYARFEGESKFLLHQLRARRSLFVGEQIEGWPSYLGLQVGSGVVVVTAFDAGASLFRGWSGTPAFWGALLERMSGGPRPQWNAQRWRDYAQTDRDAIRVLSAMTAKAISALLIAGIVGAYVLCVGPLNYLVLRNYRRRVWLVLTTPVVAVVFVVLVTALGILGRGISSLSQHLTFLSVCGDSELAYERSFVGLWCPTSGSFHLACPSNAFIRPVTMGDYRQPVWTRLGTVRVDRGTVLEDCLFRVNELRCFQVDTVRPLGGRLRLEQEGETLVLLNETDLDLREAYLTTATETVRFGTVAAGDRKTGVGQEDPRRGRETRDKWILRVAPDWVGPRVAGRRRGRSASGDFWKVTDQATIVSNLGRALTLVALVEGLEEPVTVRGGRVRTERRLTVLRAYLPVE